MFFGMRISYRHSVNFKQKSYIVEVCSVYVENNKCESRFINSVGSVQAGSFFFLISIKSTELKPISIISII